MQADRTYGVQPRRILVLGGTGTIGAITGDSLGGLMLGGIALDKQNGGDVVVLNGDAGRVVQLGLQRQGLAVQRQGAVQITLFAEQPG